jgi:AP-2 complex subunit alpha
MCLCGCVTQAIKAPNAHETVVKVGGYILGEFGYLLKDKGVAGTDVFDSLHKRFPTAALATRSLLLSSYMKLLNTFPEIAGLVLPVFDSHMESMYV